MILNTVVTAILPAIKRAGAYYAGQRKVRTAMDGDVSSLIKTKIRQEMKNEVPLQMMENAINGVNYYKSVMEKKSKIYSSNPPKRTVTDGDAKVNAKLSDYLNIVDYNTVQGDAELELNAFGCCLKEWFVHDGDLHVKIVPTNSFYVYSADLIDRTRVTHVSVLRGEVDHEFVKAKTGMTGCGKHLWFHYSDEEICVTDENGKDITLAYMPKLIFDKGLNGFMNPFGTLPFQYLTLNSNRLMPIPNLDTLNSCINLAGFTSDLAVGIKLQCFSTFVGINIDPVQMQNFNLFPGSVIGVTSKAGAGGVALPVSIEPLAPAMQVGQSLEWGKWLLSHILETNNLRADSIGNINGTSDSSGISKAIGDSTSTEDQRKKMNRYVRYEKDDLTRILPKMIEYGKVNSLLNTYYEALPENLQISVSFPEPQILKSDAELVLEVKGKLEIGVMSQLDAIKVFNKDMTDEQAKEKLAEIQSEQDVKAQKALDNALALKPVAPVDNKTAKNDTPAK